MIRKITLLFLFLSLFSPKSHAFNLTENSQVSILTCGEGQELYTTFGHSAIRVTDTVINFDRVFNYGTFNFHMPNFYLKFFQGQLDYYLSIEKYKHFEYSYLLTSRSILEQVVNLNLEQRQKLLDFLMINYKSENKYYRYNFIFDNCATRIRDVFYTVFGSRIDFHYDSVEEKKSYRQMLGDCLSTTPWINLGIDIVFGIPLDDTVHPDEYCFLPRYLYNDFQRAEIIKEGKPQKIVLKTNEILPDRQEIQVVKWYETPIFIFSFIAGIVFIFSFISTHTLRIVDFILFFTSGFIGILITFLWFFSEHPATEYNLNIIWALPTNSLMAFLLLKKTRKNFVKKYFLVVASSNLILLITFVGLPQTIDLSLIPILILIILRGWYIYRGSLKIYR